MTHVRKKTFGWLLTLLLANLLTHYALAQPEIPGVTDITSVTNVLTKDAAGFIRDIKKACRDSTYFVRQVHDLRGTVNYREDLKAYVISYGVPNTFDSHWTGIVCNWPQAAQWAGKSVTFSGRYFQARGVMARYGGEHVFYLHVTAIQ